VTGGLIVAALVGTLVATVATVGLLGNDPGVTVTFLAATVGTELPFLLVGAAYLGYRSSFRPSVRMPGREALPTLLGGLLASLVTVAISYAVTDTVLPAIELSPGFTQYSPLGELTGVGLVLGAVLSLLVIAPVEEFLFRGVIQGRLRAALDPVGATVLAGAAFALFHVYPVALLSPPPLVVLHMATYYTVMGSIFGLVYHRTGTLVAPVVVHGAFNAVLFSLPLVV
jgi:membrane protease YdiL (CAAX protease family)